METERAEQAREQRAEKAVERPARQTRQTQGRETALAPLTRLRAVAAEPDGLLSLPPQQLRLLASALGNEAMGQLLEAGPQPWLEEPSLLSWNRTTGMTTNQIVTASPMLSPGPGALPPVNELPPPSACRVSEN